MPPGGSQSATAPRSSVTQASPPDRRTSASRARKVYPTLAHRLVPGQTQRMIGSSAKAVCTSRVAASASPGVIRRDAGEK